MPAKLLSACLNPWQSRREQAQRRVDELRHRDGDTCRRCRRPMRFDLPLGDDRAPKAERILPAAGRAEALDQFVLCHVRCNQGMIDHTAQVQERRAKRHGALGIAAE